jgi:hypothetical protein
MRTTKLNYNLNSLKVWWSAVKSHIVQDAPAEIEFCQFECKRSQCMMELTGSCDILPWQAAMRESGMRPSLVQLVPAPAASRPAWAKTPRPAAPTLPAPAH